MAIYQDIDISFSANPSTKDLMKNYDVQAATFALKNILLTAPGQNFGDNEFGVGLNDMQFEIMSPVLSSFLQRKITEQVTIYAPEIQLQAVQVAQDFDTGLLRVIILYYVLGNPNVQTYNLSLSKSR